MKLKKIVTFVLAMVMVFAMGTTVFAAEGDNPPTTGSIKITDSDATDANKQVSAEGRTFTAYRILNATEVFGEGNDKPATGYAYTIPSNEIRTALATKFNVTEKGATETDAAYDQRIIEAVRAAAEANVAQTAKDLLKIAKDNSATSVTINGGEKKTGLPFGYYVIEDNTAPTTETGPVSAVMLDTNNPDVEIKVKAEKPSIDKSIVGANDTDPDSTGNVKTNKVNIGDTVPYVIDSTVPHMTGYTKYYFIVHDTMSKGLTFNEDSVAITLAGETLTKGTDYTVTTSKTPEGNTEIKIVFNNFIQYKGTLTNGQYTGSKEGQPIVITYNATVNGDAEVGKIPNTNDVKLEYSNKPNTTPQGENEPGPEDEDVTGETPNSTTKTYTTGLTVLKVSNANDDTKVLKGATFELKGTLNKVEVTTEEKFVADENGTYWKLADGKYTTVDPATFNDAANKDELLAKYASTTQKYKKTTEEKTASGSDGAKTVTATTGEDGKITFDGMTKGSYTLTETEAPDGYNKLKDPITFDVTWTAPATGSNECTWAVTNVQPNTYQISVETDGTLKIKVLNQSGTELPSTGGMGTRVFYILGTVLVLGAGIILVSRKRASSK